jgi:hypothetical protein
VSKKYPAQVEIDETRSVVYVHLTAARDVKRLGIQTIIRIQCATPIFRNPEENVWSIARMLDLVEPKGDTPPERTTNERHEAFSNRLALLLADYTDGDDTQENLIAEAVDRLRREGDPIVTPGKDGIGTRDAKVVGVFQSAGDPTKFGYTVRWFNGEVGPLDIDEVESGGFIESINFMELRSLFDTGPPDNLDMGILLAHFENVAKGMEEYLRTYRELKCFCDLKEQMLSR